MSILRPAAVADQFYPGNPGRLAATLKEMILSGPQASALGVMVPHAGYVYSGWVAGAVYGAVDLPHSFIILGPNHTGLGPAASIMTGGSWQLPGGEAVIDQELARAIMDGSGLLSADETAHAYEHSIEVQLPFLQYLVEEPTFVPISLMTTSAAACRQIGEAIAAAVRRWSEPVLIVASSDMSHYEPQAVAQRLDQLALERLLERDPEGLLATVRAEGISMCGAAPAAAMLFACNALGASQAQLVKYMTSGDVSGDYERVVGYAGVIVS